MKRSKRIIICLAVFLALFAAREGVYLLYPAPYLEYVEKYAVEYELDPYFLLAVIKTESRFDREAQSHKGAMGLMQLTESTAYWIAETTSMKNFSTEDLYDPELNIWMGSWYLDNLSKEFSSTELVLAAYNAGRGNVKKWTDSQLISADGTDFENIPYGETVNYIKKVRINQKIYSILYRLD
ncbi:lytic transglycosylase domain-containing protein [Aminipila butyrica]|uniref:Lytic transglycosylase domain-containing protein n=1 Tax=Aminipila butyrica TaxID=433296 RepID=A0A858BWR5_9FIRM|nr:lytic transglycosylase domain-containing protein [Aminipila butyrica]QIB69525.1 lytic transglycosylase domain-containing protein [Aminipila butyrica]